MGEQRYRVKKVYNPEKGEWQWRPEHKKRFLYIFTWWENVDGYLYNRKEDAKTAIEEYRVNSINSIEYID